MKLSKVFLVFGIILLTATTSWAQRRGRNYLAGGSHAWGGGLAIIAPGQNDLDRAIDTVNTANGVAINKLGAGYELFGHYTYSFSGTIFALQFRPSYVMQNSSGAGHDMKLSGFTFFPIFRLVPLENNFIQFFMQVGLGYGQLSGEFSGGGNSVAFKGSAFGALGGIGANFCFTMNHCMNVEGNLRYLPFERNIVTSAGGNSASLGFDGGLGSGDELEANNRDVATTLSGIQGIVGYIYRF